MCARKFILFVVTSLWAHVALADTTWVAGGDVSGEWTSAGSPYMIQGDVYVPADAALEIGPGVTVFFASQFSQINVEFGARLEAIGTLDDSIYFTTDTLANPGRWEGIWIVNDPDTCHLEYCVVEHATSLGIGANWFHGPTRLRHCTFRHNSAQIGGVADIWGAYIDISQCIFESNSAEWQGGVFNLSEARGMISDCVFRNNSGGTEGGAIRVGLQHDSLAFRNCDFIDNQATEGGAVILFSGLPILVFEDCRFINNHANLRGGAILDAHNVGGATYRACVFDGNVADSSGGALYLYNHSRLDRCVITNNHAVNGGGLHLAEMDGADPEATRCIIIGNAAADQGGGIYLGGSATIRSCIVVANEGLGIRVPPQGLSEPDNIAYNLLYENLGGNFSANEQNFGAITTVNANGDFCDAYFNIFLDPQFVDTANGDYHLLATSPCIDAGDPELSHDPDSTIADIGAFYYDQTQVAEEERTAVRGYRLAQNYPNPFNSSTQIRFDLPVASHVTLTVFDLLGREVAVLNDEPMTAGTHVRTFDAANLPSGVYLYRLRTAAASQTHKMILLK